MHQLALGASPSFLFMLYLVLTELELPSLRPDLYEGIGGRTVWKSAPDESDSESARLYGQ